MTVPMQAFDREFGEAVAGEALLDAFGNIRKAEIEAQQTGRHAALQQWFDLQRAAELRFRCLVWLFRFLEFAMVTVSFLARGWKVPFAAGSMIVLAETGLYCLKLKPQLHPEVIRAWRQGGLRSEHIMVMAAAWMKLGIPLGFIQVKDTWSTHPLHCGDGRIQIQLRVVAGPVNGADVQLDLNGRFLLSQGGVLPLDQLTISGGIEQTWPITAKERRLLCRQIEDYEARTR